MLPIPYARHRSLPVIIQHAIWLYLRITLSYHDVEDLLAECGVEVSYETVRRWVLKFGPAIAKHLLQRRPKPEWNPPRAGARATAHFFLGLPQDRLREGVVSGRGGDAPPPRHRPANQPDLPASARGSAAGGAPPAETETPDFGSIV